MINYEVDVIPYIGKFFIVLYHGSHSGGCRGVSEVSYETPFYCFIVKY